MRALRPGPGRLGHHQGKSPRGRGAGSQRLPIAPARALPPAPGVFQDRFGQCFTTRVRTEVLGEGR